MTLAKRTSQVPAALMEQVVINGDLAVLTPEQRVNYYKLVCESLGLNPLTAPFAYIRLNNKLTLYAKRDCTDQLRALHNISVTITGREVTEGVYVVTARATTAEGRTEESIGAVPIDNLKGEFLANSLMKAETKSKRRVTLSIVGLGWLDETEVGSIVDGQVIQVDQATGEIALPEAPSTPVSSGPPNPPQSRFNHPRQQLAAPPAESTLTVAQLRAAIEAEGMPWGNFETIVLRTTWATFIKRPGATPAVALHQWGAWKKAHPGGVPAVAAGPATGGAEENATEPAEAP